MLQTLERRRKYTGAILSDKHALTVERSSYLFLPFLITLSNFRKTIFIFNAKGSSMQIRNLSVDSPTYDILELYSLLLTFYHDVHYKQRRIRNYEKVE